MWMSYVCSFSAGLGKPVILGKPHSEENQQTWTLTAKETMGPKKGAGRIGMVNGEDSQPGLQGNEKPPFEGHPTQLFR